MKKLYKVETNNSTMFITYDDEEKVVMVLDNAETNNPDTKLTDVEDDSSWNRYDNIDDIEEWLEIDNNNPDASRITEEIDF